MDELVPFLFTSKTIQNACEKACQEHLLSSLVRCVWDTKRTLPQEGLGEGSVCPQYQSRPRTSLPNSGGTLIYSPLAACKWKVQTAAGADELKHTSSSPFLFYVVYLIRKFLNEKMHLTKLGKVILSFFEAVTLK